MPTATNAWVLERILGGKQRSALVRLPIVRCGGFDLISKGIRMNSIHPQLMLPTFVEEGSYDVFFKYYETKKVFAAIKIVMWFQIGPGEGFQKLLPAYRNVHLHTSKPGKSGKFIAHGHGKFMREWMKLFGRDPDLRLDRIPMTKLKNHAIEARIKTVIKDAKQEKLHESNYYSVIEELIGIKV